MEEPFERLDDEQIRSYVALMEVAGQLRFRLESHLKAESELSSVQFDILGRLMREPGHRLRMTDLADGLAISRSGLTYQVQALADSQLLLRSSDPADERSTLVELSALGQREFLRLLPRHVEIVRALLFDALPDQDARELGLVLQRVSAHVRSLPPRSAKPRSSQGPTMAG